MSQKIKTSVEIDGSLTANSIVKSGGTASQILAADGSVVTAGSGVTISGGTISASDSAGVLSFNTRTGAVTLTSGDVTTALGYTPYDASNPAEYISSYTETDTLATVVARGYITNGFRPIRLDTSSGGVMITGNSKVWATGYYFLGSSNTFRGGFGATGNNDGLSNYWIGPGYNNYYTYIDSSQMYHSNSMRSPIFYDSNDTGYYLDIASYSRINQLSIGTVNNAYALYNNGNSYFNGAVEVDDTLYVSSGYSARAPIFYDIDNTGYYLDPASTSNLNALTLAGTFSAPGYNKTNWDTAYGWGNHASAGYVPSARTITINGTSYDLSSNRSWTVTGTETDTLATVTGRGSSTSTLSNFNGGLTATKTAKNAYAMQLKGGLYGAPRLQLYDLAVDSNAFVGIGVDMSTGSYEFSNYFPRYNGNGRWSVGSWAGDFGTGQYVSGYNEKLWVNESGAQFNVSLTDTVDMRAPIFYDSNDTGYYLNGAGYSLFSKLRLNANWGASGGDDAQLSIRSTYPSITFRNTASNTMWLRHMDGSGEIQHYAATDGADSNNWSIKHTMYKNGDFFSSNSMRSPIFYDSNNTGYYVDPASSSTVYQTNYAVSSYLGTYRWKTFPQDNGGGIDFYMQGTNSVDSVAAYLQMSIVGSRGFYWSGGKAEFSQDVRTPIFYDSDDTGYYVNPNSTGTSYRGRGEIFLGPNTSAEYLRLGGNGGATDHSTVSTSNGNLHIDAKAGNGLYLGWYNTSDVMVGGAIQALAYYDRNNTGYYVDPASTSNFNAINFSTLNSNRSGASGNTINIDNVGSGTWPFVFKSSAVGNDNESGFWVGGNAYPDMRLRREDGNVRALISSWERSYTSFGLTDSTDMRAPIFYDANNTGYYVDPASTSNFNVINSQGYNLLSRLDISVSAGNWYTIATNPGNRAHATFDIWDLDSGMHGEMKFVAGISFGGTGQITMLNKSWHSSGGIFDGIRIRKTGTYDTHYLQIYVPNSGTLRIAMTDNFQESGWTLTNGGTGNPGAYTAAEVTPDSYGPGLITSGDIGIQKDTPFINFYSTSTGRSGYVGLSSGYDMRVSNASSGNLYLGSGNTVIVENNLQAAVFYDYNNTGYYVDPASLSNVNSIAAGNYIFANAYLETNGPVYGTIFYDNNDRSYYCDPNSTSRLLAVNAPSGFTSVGNPWGTSDSAYFPNGITTAGGTNWIYGNTYVGNAPSNGAGHEFKGSGKEYHRSNESTTSQGASGLWLSTQSASGNFVPYSFESEYGNHSWGTVARFRINQAGADRPSIQFSNASNDTRWNIGYCAADDNFRIVQNMGYRNDNSNHDGWGTERLIINTDGNIYSNGLYQSYSSLRSPIYYDSNNTGYYIDAASTSNLNALTVGGNSVLTYGNAPRAANSYVMFYEGFTLNANDMSTNSTGFTYSNNAPWTGPIARFSTGGGYDLWLNASYGGDGTALSYRTRNGDAGTHNSWHRIYSDSYKPNADKVNGYGGYDHVGSGLRPFYNWGGSNGGASAPTGGTYTNGISVGSHPSDPAYGFQIANNMWNTGLWTRGYNGYSFDGWVRLLDSSNYSQYCNFGGNTVYGAAFYDANDTGYYVDPASTSNVNQMVTGVLRFRGEGGDSGNGSLPTSYGIYQQGGSWTHPYPDLCIGFHTGIKIGAHYGYNGTRFYNNSDWATITASVNDGDNNFRGYYDIIAYASDKRLKHKVEPIENALEKVKSLTGMTYQWNEIGKEHGWDPDTTVREAGVFAQDVQSVLPEAVKLAPFDDDKGISKSGENFLTVKYDKIVPLLIEAIKEQQTQIEELKELVNKLINK